MCLKLIGVEVCDETIPKHSFAKSDMIQIFATYKGRGYSGISFFSFTGCTVFVSDGKVSNRRYLQTALLLQKKFRIQDLNQTKDFVKHVKWKLQLEY